MFVALIAVLIVVGIAGTLLPLLPGLGLVWVAVVLFAVVEDVGRAGWLTVAVVTVIAAVAIYLGFRLPQRAAGEGGISVRGQLFAGGLAVVGFFIIPVIGAAIGFVLGVYLVSLTTDRRRAWTNTLSTVRSMVIASGVQFAAAVTIGIVWVAWVIADRAIG